MHALRNHTPPSCLAEAAAEAAPRRHRLGRREGHGGGLRRNRRLHRLCLGGAAGGAAVAPRRHQRWVLRASFIKPEAAWLCRQLGWFYISLSRPAHTSIPQAPTPPRPGPTHTVIARRRARRRRRPPVGGQQVPGRGGAPDGRQPRAGLAPRQERRRAPEKGGVIRPPPARMAGRPTG
jgi:hypothetical protein